jgi:hypothetical protein
MIVVKPKISSNGCLWMINDTKTCSTTCIMPFFWSHLTTFVGRINICCGLFSLTCIIFICPNMVFPLLLNIIPLVGLDVLIEIIHDFLKFYLWNVVILANRHFVIVRNWNWNSKYLINYSSSHFACLNISKMSFWKKY